MTDTTYSRWFLVPPEEVTDEALGHTFLRPAYLDNATGTACHLVNTDEIPPLDDLADGEMFLVRAFAPDEATLDEIQEQPDVALPPGDGETGAPLAAILNRWHGLDLDPSEWAQANNVTHDGDDVSADASTEVTPAIVRVDDSGDE